MYKKVINYQAGIWPGLIKMLSKIFVKLQINWLEMIRSFFEGNLLLRFSIKKVDKVLFSIEKQRFYFSSCL